MPRPEIEPHQEPPSASASEEGQPMPSCHANAKQHWLLGLAIETDNRNICIKTVDHYQMNRLMNVAALVLRCF